MTRLGHTHVVLSFQRVVLIGYTLLLMASLSRLRAPESIGELLR